MRPVSRALLHALLIVVSWFAATAIPATAEISKHMNPCHGGMCASFRAAIAIPPGWAEDREASRYFGAQMLLPAGQDFEKAPAKIYAVVRYNPRKQPLSDFLPDALRQWKQAARDAAIADLAEMPRRDGQGSFVRRQFEAPKLKAQGYELQAVTMDRDADGNLFVVTITLSANSKAALRDAEAAYLSILRTY